MPLRSPSLIFVLCIAAPLRAATSADGPSFERDVAPIFEKRCLECHGSADDVDDPPKGKLSLTTRAAALAGGESGPAVVAGKPDESLLLDFVRHAADGKALMPKNRTPLTNDEVAVLERWIAGGAAWPERMTLKDRRFENYRWWSLEPLVKPSVPSVMEEHLARSRNPIDAFIVAALETKQLTPSREADPAVLCRRLYFDLIGLPPSPEELAEFIAACRDGESSERAYAALVDKLLASPHYGERWARHWLDVVHFGETHGYDKDKPRPNAWPYRDYVIRSFNADKPYTRFVEEQLAGDVLYPATRDGVEALGFISAGPWDLIGHAEVPESKTDGKIARHLDRDDMVANTIQTFDSLTVQCAQCHDHKFDPIRQEDYYRLQAVFAAVDRTDKAYDVAPQTASQRQTLTRKLEDIDARQVQLDRTLVARAGNSLRALDEKIAELAKHPAEGSQKSSAFGYHSAVASEADIVKWVQLDLGRSRAIDRIVLHPAHDDFNGIGAGFGFPPRYKIELSDDKEFRTGVSTIADFTPQDLPNPGTTPQSTAAGSRTARYVRITAVKLAPRKNDFIFALAEVEVRGPGDTRLSPSEPGDSFVTALDSIEAPPRWRKANLVDGEYPGRATEASQRLASLRRQRTEQLQATATPQESELADRLSSERQSAEEDLRQLPPPAKCYVGAVHHGSGAFRGTGPDGGRPRPIFLLARGNVLKPGKQVEPGALSLLSELPGDFGLSTDADEGERRAALARWIVDRRNPLTWRSIVNRIWQHHFGRGLVDTPNDFGRNGALPTHPELLDWLAAEFRDGGEFIERQSFKSLHRLIVLSATYRQTSTPSATSGLSSPVTVDADNRLLWRANRRRLDAEQLRDALLLLGGKLDRTMYGPGFQDFVIEKPQHSPHYEYHLHDPNDPKSHRRSIYRFIVRSQPQPFMTTFDCADPSMQVDKRNESLSPLQALALLNNRLTLAMSEHFAERLSEHGSVRRQIERAFLEAIGRRPNSDELPSLVAYAEQHGSAAACRVVLNLNEFIFVD